MKPEEQRIAIAEAHTGKQFERDERFDNVWKSNGVISIYQPPDYLNDLNAMHEAVVSVLNTGELKYRFTRWVSQVAPVMEWPTHWKMVNATAAQRAEAFLRTLGKWVEEVK